VKDLPLWLNLKSLSEKQKKLFNIEINYLWCKGCGICIYYCPKKVYTAGELGKPQIMNMDDCINCRLCVMRCPDLAIEVYPREEEKL